MKAALGGRTAIPPILDNPLPAIRRDDPIFRDFSNPRGGVGDQQITLGIKVIPAVEIMAASQASVAAEIPDTSVPAKKRSRRSCQFCVCDSVRRR